MAKLLIVKKIVENCKECMYCRVVNRSLHTDRWCGLAGFDLPKTLDIPNHCVLPDNEEDLYDQ